MPDDGKKLFDYVNQDRSRLLKLNEKGKKTYFQYGYDSGQLDINKLTDKAKGYITMSQPKAPTLNTNTRARGLSSPSDRRMTPQISQTKLEQTPAGLAGFGDSLTLGLLSKGNEELFEQKRKDSPIAYTAGQVGGFVAPALASYGTVGKAAGKAVANQVKNRLGQEVIKGAASSVPLSLGLGAVAGDKPKELAKRVGRDIVLGAGIDVATFGLGRALRNVIGKGNLQRINIPDVEVAATKQPSVSGRYKPKNTQLDNAISKYNEAIEQIQNKYQTNQLRSDEMASIKNEMGIDLERLVKDIEVAENQNVLSPLKNIGERQRLGRSAGVIDSPLPKLAERPRAPRINQAVDEVASTADEIKPTEKIVSSNKEKTPFKQKLKNFYRRVVDTNSALKQVDDKTFTLATNAKKTGGTVNYIMNDGLVDMQGNTVGKSLKEVVEKIPQEKYDDFWYYALHKHNVDRAKQGKNVFSEFSPEMSERAYKQLEKANPEFKEIQKDINEFLQTFSTKWSKEAGLIEEDLWKSLQETYPNYVPTNRSFSELEGAMPSTNGRGFVNQSSGLKKATGSSRDITDPTENIMELINRTVRTAKYNEVGQSLVDSIRKNPDKLKQFAEILPDSPKMPRKQSVKFTPDGKVEVGSIVKAGDRNNYGKVVGYDGNTNKYTVTFKSKEGATATKTFDANMLESANKKTKSPNLSDDDRLMQFNSNLDNIVTVLDKGKKVNVQVNDKYVLDALKRLNESNLDDIDNLAKSATNAFKSLITQKNPVFAIRNIARDVPTAYINSESVSNPYKYLRDLGRSAKDIKANSPLYQQYKALGGQSSNFFDSNNVSRSAKDLTKKNVLKRFGDSIEGFNNVTEVMPRYAEFKRVFEQTGDIQKALYASGEVSTNFARGGDITKKIDAYVPYLNASVQGLDKLVRTFKNRPLGTVLKGATGVTAPTLILNEINKNNEDYKQLDNRTKDNYFLIPKGDGTFFKIPKAREYGVIFSVLTERILRQMAGEEDSWKGFGNTVATNFSPANPIENNIMSPLIYNIPKNEDFAGRSIVPLGMKLDGRSPRYQYDEKTSELGKVIGDKLNLSPKQIDYLIRSYTGVIGQLLLPATTKYNYNGSTFENLTRPITSQFNSDPLYSNQAITDFYDNYDKFKQIAADKNIKENIPSKVVTREEKLRNDFAKTSKRIGEIYDEIREAEQKNKKELVKRLRREIITLSNQANQKAKGVK